MGELIVGAVIMLVGILAGAGITQTKEKREDSDWGPPRG